MPRYWFEILKKPSKLQHAIITVVDRALPTDEQLRKHLENYPEKFDLSTLADELRELETLKLIERSRDYWRLVR